ncbi:hypothetical protein GGR56DRAFT_524721 [Xylariaceae sp. FL0804]|nr:hypothetical protein GGR56DRAFT_524721 [Xylariaceae sp. FL0804]
MASANAPSSRPMSVKEIADQAYRYDFNPNIALATWDRSAHQIFHQAQIYMREGNLGQAYLLFLRYCSLKVDKFKTHPDAKTHAGKLLVKHDLETMKIALDSLEKIKPIVQAEYEEWCKSDAERQALRDQQGQKRIQSKSASQYEQHALNDPSLSTATKLLDAGEYLDLAVDLGQREIRRRDAARKANRAAVVVPQEEQQRHMAGSGDDWNFKPAVTQDLDDEGLRKQMQSTRRRLDGEDGDLRDLRDTTRATTPSQALRGPHRVPSEAPRSSSFHYPSIKKSVPVQYEPQQLIARHESSVQPLRPPKEADFSPRGDYPARQTPLSAPEPPAKVQIEAEKTLMTPEQSQERPARPPKVHETATAPEQQQKHRTTFKPQAYLENGTPIRPIILPKQLRHRFVSIASENTRQGLEMCGILCGTAVNNCLFVSCLFIPEQRCTSDTCETVSEEALMEYCIMEDLLVLGWIHTHPTQSCFMSSRDLHTQSGYQIMLPESVAIVCAPRFEPSYGIFRLTDPPGLPHVLNCTQQATFHQHAVDNLYTSGRHPPGHVLESDDLDFYVYDQLRGAKVGSAHREK